MPTSILLLKKLALFIASSYYISIAFCKMNLYNFFLFANC